MIIPITWTILHHEKIFPKCMYLDSGTLFLFIYFSINTDSFAQKCFTKLLIHSFIYLSSIINHYLIVVLMSFDAYNVFEFEIDCVLYYFVFLFQFYELNFIDLSKSIKIYIDILIE